MFNLSFTPELFFLLPAAILLDGVGIILFCCGLDDLGFLDIAGGVIFYPWLILRGKGIPSSSDKKKKMNGIIEKIGGIYKGKTSKFLAPVIELIPYVGVWPSWFLLTVNNLKKQD
jgi:hypothetical protein